jgi:homoserine kinase
LSDTISLRSHVRQSAAHALLVAACYENSLDLIGSCLDDIVIEPQRKSLVPGFDDAKAAALDHSALGCSLSGSGPTIFAWCRAADSQNIAAAMRQVFDERSCSCEIWVSPVDAPGARIIS